MCLGIEGWRWEVGGVGNEDDTIQDADNAFQCTLERTWLWQGTVSQDGHAGMNGKLDFKEIWVTDMNERGWVA